MSLQDWLDSGWIVVHAATADEVAGLVAVVDRDLQDSAVAAVSADGRLAMAYNAALQLATLALAAEGYRPGRQRAHERAILSLRDTVGTASTTVDMLDLTRRKRNNANYEQVGIASDSDVAELRAVVVGLRAEVLRWLKKQHPAFFPPGVKI